MAITNDDVKLFESQRLTDEEDGGGRVTGREVIDGNVNNLFGCGSLGTTLWPGKSGS